MNLRFIWTDTKEAASILGLVFLMYVVLGMSGSLSGVTKLTSNVVQDQTMMKAVIVFFQALSSTITFVPIAFILGNLNQGKTPRLSTLAALPIPRLSLALHRYIGILVIQGVILFVLVALAPIAANVIGTPVIDQSIATIVANAGVALATMAFYQLLANIFPESGSILVGLFITGTIVSVAVGSFNPELYESPLIMAATATALIVAEIVVFSNRRTFV